MTPKDKKIIEDAERLGIPVFVLTAKDKVSVRVLEAYLGECENEGCSYDHCSAISARINDFFEWQMSNKDKVKKPD
jgi:hypothetical protein